MAVRQMTNEATYEAYNAAVAAGEADERGLVNGKKVERVSNYHGHEEGVHHGRLCAHSKTRRAGADLTLTPECVLTRYHKESRYDAQVNADGEWVLDAEGQPTKVDRYTEACRTMGPLYMETSHVGLVLHTGERNGYHDSDFTVGVWDGDGIDTFIYASTRGWTYPNSATPDATPEVREAYAAWQKARDLAHRRSRYIRQLKDTYKAQHAPVKGSWVKGINPRSRKFPKGMSGLVLWVSQEGGRVGISVDGSKTAQDRMNLVFVDTETSSGVDNLWAVLEDEEGWDARPQWALDILAECQRRADAREVAREAAVEAATDIPKNAWVRITEGANAGAEGLAFFFRLSDGLVGIAVDNTKNRNRYANTLWVKATMLEQDESCKPGWARRYLVRG